MLQNQPGPVDCKVETTGRTRPIRTVDVIDVQLVTGAFGLNAPAYDFNKDGAVNVSDIQFVANRWLVGC